MSRWGLCVFGPSLLVLALGCTPRQRTRPRPDPPPPPNDFRANQIEYVDSDAFDAVLETALVSQGPAIVILTKHKKPDWGDRLNAWIAAWNRGGPPRDGASYRMQAPLLAPKVDGDTVRELRLLIENLMDRLDDRARARSEYWAEEKVRNRRVALLRPYNLRFHVGEDGLLQVILFHGRYAPYYPDFMRSLVGAEEIAEWQRAYTCSLCARKRAEAADDEVRRAGGP